MFTEKKVIFHICSKESIGIYIRDLSSAFKDEIDKESDDYINKIDKDKYVEFLLGKYSIAVPNLYFDKVEASTGKKNYSSRAFSVWI